MASYSGSQLFGFALERREPFFELFHFILDGAPFTGTKIGNGCTSGHGICGLARLSVRSLVAVAVFFGVAIITVAVTRIV